MFARGSYADNPNCRRSACRDRQLVVDHVSDRRRAGGFSKPQR